MFSTTSYRYTAVILCRVHYNSHRQVVVTQCPHLFDYWLLPCACVDKYTLISYLEYVTGISIIIVGVSRTIKPYNQICSHLQTVTVWIYLVSFPVAIRSLVCWVWRYFDVRRTRNVIRGIHAFNNSLMKI